MAGCSLLCEFTGMYVQYYNYTRNNLACIDNNTNTKNMANNDDQNS